MNIAEKNQKYYVGLDIGTTKIVAMVGIKNEYGKIQILGYGYSISDGINKGVVVNITRTTNSIQRAVQEAQEKTGLEIRNVEVGIAGQHIRSMQHSDYIIRTNPEKVIDEKDLEQLGQQVRNLGLESGQEIIHILPQEYKVDGIAEIKDPIGMEGARLEAIFHLVIGQTSSIRSILRCVKDAGLNPIGLTLEPIASAESVLDDDEKEAGIALVDIGGGTTDVAIFKDGIIRHTAVIPMGGNIITKDIEAGCGILLKQAEKLKVRFGSAWPAQNKTNEFVKIAGIRGKETRQISLRNLSNIIHARTVEIIAHVFNVIKNYGYEEHKKRLIGGIVLTGGGSLMQHIEFLVTHETGLSTRIGLPNEHLSNDSDPQMTSPIYATSIGLVMCAMKKGNESLNTITLPIQNEKEETVNIENITAKQEENNNVEDDNKERKGFSNIAKNAWEKFLSILDKAE